MVLECVGRRTGREALVVSQFLSQLCVERRGVYLAMHHQRTSTNSQQQPCRRREHSCWVACE